MITKCNLILFIMFSILLGSHAYTQQNLVSFETKFDIDLNTKVLFWPKDVQWVDELDAFIYRAYTKEGEKVFSYNPTSMEKKELWKIQGLIPSEFKYGLQTKKSLRFQKPKFFVLEGPDRKWEYDIETGVTRKVFLANEKPWDFQGYSYDNYSMKDSILSPDGKQLAFIRNYNVFVKDKGKAKDESIQLSYDGSPKNFYSTTNMIWSPDSQKLFVQRVLRGYDRKIYMIESSPEDQLEPKLHSMAYNKPGDDLPQITPTIFSINDRRQINLDENEIENQYRLTHFKWRRDSKSVVFEYDKRGHQIYKLLELDATNGKLKTLINEKTDTFLNIGSFNGKRFRYDVADGEEIIWASERDGWNHLYLFDGREGKIKNQITKGEWVVRKVNYVDEKNRTIFFEASGYVKGMDPYYLQLFKINFDGSGLKQLTTEDANHEMVFSGDHSLFIDTYSRVDLPPRTVLRRASDGKILKEIEQSDPSELLAMGWNYPEVFKSKGRDGKTDIWGIIVKPSDFSSDKKYPLIELIYAGPHDSYVPKSFTTNQREDMYGVAEQGFIVVQIDGMGTSNRSKKFHDVAFKNLIDAGLPDRINWIENLAEEKDFIDINKVGIYGRSAGGQNTAGALLFYPEFYKVGVATSGNFDNRMDKLSWNEQWMGYPVGTQYIENSTVENAFKLEGDLMIILGELDTNVDPSSSKQFVNALEQANKDFEFVLLTGEDHQATGKYGILKRREFLSRKILKN